jgi:hypothetical protein
MRYQGAASALTSSLFLLSHPARAQPPPSQPSPPEHICGPNIIYGVYQVALPGGGPLDGVYQIDVSTGVATPVKWLTNAYNLAVRAPASLWAGTSPPGPVLYSIDLTTTAPPAPSGVTSPAATGMGEGGGGSLFDVDVFGNLHGLLPQPPILIGNAAGISYPGDLVLDRSTCQLLAGSATPALPWLRVNRSDGSVEVLNANCGLSHIGLAFDGSGRLWSAQAPLGAPPGVVPLDPRTVAATGAIVPVIYTPPGGIPVPLPLVDLANEPCGSCQPSGLSDLGDASDSSNHFGVPMSAYGMSMAQFPTVYDMATGLPPGPKHWFSDEVGWLGPVTTDEREADLPPDQDGVPNIEPLLNLANLDVGDDGVQCPLVLQYCESSSLTYTLNVVGRQRTRYFNVWLDFNRDGDWSDTMQCIDGQGQVRYAPEWTVTNQSTNLGPGIYTLTASSLSVYEPLPPSPVWMRITLSDSPATSPDGAGPPGGWEYGETEDYLLSPAGPSGEYAPQARWHLV